MRVFDACDIAIDCGLDRIIEAIYNIELHATSIFSYSDVQRELHELRIDAENYDCERLILDVFPELGDAKNKLEE